MKCNYCGEEFPATGEYFRQDKKTLGGLRPQCKACYRKAKKRWYDETKPERNAKQRRSYAKDPERKLETNQRYFESHPEVKSESDKRYYLQHSEQIKQRVNIYKHLNPHVAKASRKRSYILHPEIARARNQRRRAKKRELLNNFTASDWLKALEYFDYKCAVCGRTGDFWTKLSPDHWIALSDPRPDNPGTVPKNIVPLCHAKSGVPSGKPCCNNSKHDRDAQEWLLWRFDEQKAHEIWERIDAYFRSL